MPHCDLQPPPFSAVNDLAPNATRRLIALNGWTLVLCQRTGAATGLTGCGLLAGCAAPPVLCCLPRTPDQHLCSLWPGPAAGHPARPPGRGHGRPARQRTGLRLQPGAARGSRGWALGRVASPRAHSCCRCSPSAGPGHGPCACGQGRVRPSRHPATAAADVVWLAHHHQVCIAQRRGCRCGGGNRCAITASGLCGSGRAQRRARRARCLPLDGRRVAAPPGGLRADPVLWRALRQPGLCCGEEGHVACGYVVAWVGGGEEVKVVVVVVVCVCVVVCGCVGGGWGGGGAAVLTCGPCRSSDLSQRLWPCTFALRPRRTRRSGTMRVGG